MVRKRLHLNSQRGSRIALPKSNLSSSKGWNTHATSSHFGQPFSLFEHGTWSFLQSFFNDKMGSMNTFNLGDAVRQISTGGTGTIVGIHPVLPPTADRKVYEVRFNFGCPASPVPPEDLELFAERRSGNERRSVRDRRGVAIVKYQGQCVLDCLVRMLDLPLNEVRTMFAESIKGQQDPSNLNDVTDVLMENGYVVGLTSENNAGIEGVRCFVALCNDIGIGHAVVVEGKTIFDPDHQFNSSWNFNAQCLAFGWTVANVLLVTKLPTK